jgi:hypothetical protein
MKKHILSELFMVGLLAFALLLVPTQTAHAGPARQSASDDILKKLTQTFNDKDLNGSLALMADNAMVSVVNPSDIASGTLVNGAKLVYEGKQGAQSQLANFFSTNFSNGFTIGSTNFKTTATTFNGPMQLAIRNFLIDTEVDGTFEAGKIKTLVITEKNISLNKPAAPAAPAAPAPVSKPINMPVNSPATGIGDSEFSIGEGSGLLYLGFVFALTGCASLAALYLLKKPRKSR